VLLLAVDTSGRNGSLTLVRAEPDEFEVLELIPLTGRMYSAELIPSLQAALAHQNLRKTDLDGFAVASGPGSFTGLRVGISTVKALSEALHKPIAAVSVLEAAARLTKIDGRVIVALDAGRKQVFVGNYDFTNGERQELLVSWEEFIQSRKHSKARQFSPDVLIREVATTYGVSLETIPAPQADAFARIGYEKLIAGQSFPAELLEANYIRASDAELCSLPKLIS
jgi:tRNA threonylcarbamoyladenosine biosynthesis protein TsaB